jgi:hypothetical protein
MASPPLSPPPLDSSIAAPGGRVAPDWARWLQQLQTLVKGLAGGEVDTAWQTPTLNAGWANFGTGWETAGYRKLSSGLVVLRGLVVSASTGVVFTLPVGYRPALHRVLATSCSPGADAWTRLDVLSTGDVRFPTTAPTVYGSLACCFYADG